MTATPNTDTFAEILESVQESTDDNECKHGVLLCECMEDCMHCFEEALGLFRESAIVSVS